jgi:hypothetical protein
VKSTFGKLRKWRILQSVFSAICREVSPSCFVKKSRIKPINRVQSEGHSPLSAMKWGRGAGGLSRHSFGATADEVVLRAQGREANMLSPENRFVNGSSKMSLTIRHSSFVIFES